MRLIRNAKPESKTYPISGQNGYTLLSDQNRLKTTPFAQTHKAHIREYPLPANPGLDFMCHIDITRLSAIVLTCTNPRHQAALLLNVLSTMYRIEAFRVLYEKTVLTVSEKENDL